MIIFSECVCAGTKRHHRYEESKRKLYKRKQMYYLLLMIRSMHRSLWLSWSCVKASMEALHHGCRHKKRGDEGHPVWYSPHYLLPTHQKTPRINTGVMTTKSIISLLLCECVYCSEKLQESGLRILLAWKQGLLERFRCCWTRWKWYKSFSIIISPSLSKEDTWGCTSVIVYSNPNIHGKSLQPRVICLILRCEEML